ncbi:hypothetical protein [Haloplanus sp. C73]|uniref:hypothetical protein n=1 Tax=Haloplanus sp. C73 TaxID=3421641 RepID=UPI003EB6CBEF
MADDSLLAWVLAAFHTATLLVPGLALLYAVGALGSLLQGVHTATGFVLYLSLWGLGWWTTKRWLAATPLAVERETLTAAATWGAVTGVGFLFVILAVVAVTLRELLFVAVLALVGTPVAALVGAVLGVAFALLDTLLVGLGTRLGTA